MRLTSDIKWGMYMAALGLFCLWAEWGHWNNFVLLESGRGVSIQMWKPLAWLYRLGGEWTAVAKWASLVLLGLAGVGFTLAGGILLRSEMKRMAGGASRN